MIRRLDEQPRVIHSINNISGGYSYFLPKLHVGGSCHSTDFGRSHWIFSGPSDENILPASQQTPPLAANFGGFNNPVQLFSRLISKVFPKLYHKLERTLMVPRNLALTLERSDAPSGTALVD
jgi:hypothetical protein